MQNIKERCLVRPHEGEALGFLGNEARIKISERTSPTGFSLIEFDLPEGCGAPPHQHPWDEWFYILSGGLKMMLDGESLAVGVGDTFHIPADSLHAFGAIPGGCRLLQMATAGQGEAFFRAVTAEAPSMPPDVPKLLAIGDRTQVRFSL